MRIRARAKERPLLLFLTCASKETLAPQTPDPTRPCGLARLGGPRARSATTIPSAWASSLERDARTVLEPFVPERATRALRAEEARELHDAPHVAEVAREPEREAHDAELAAHALLERAERGVCGQLRHRRAQAEQRRRAPRVAHAARAERDVVC